MKLRTLVLTVALLAALSVVAYLVNRPQAGPPADPRVGAALLDPDTVSRAASISISDQGKKVDLARAPDGSWRVPSYYDLPADFGKISHFIQDLNEAKVDRFVTSNPERLAHVGFADSMVTLADAAGKSSWSLTFGKPSESGNGRFIRFGSEPKAYFSGLHVWLDTDAKGWADARLVTVKPEDVARVEIPFDGGATVVAARAKKGAPWAAEAPEKRTLAADKVSSLLTSLTSLRFTDTLDAGDPAAAEAARHARLFKLTTFDGKILAVSLGRKPEEKRPKAPGPTPTPAAKPAADAAAPAAAKAEDKPAAPEMETIPAGPVFASVASSDAGAPVNAMMKRRAFQVDEYLFTGLPQSAAELFEAEKGK